MEFVNEIQLLLQEVSKVKLIPVIISTVLLFIQQGLCYTSIWGHIWFPLAHPRYHKMVEEGGKSKKQAERQLQKTFPRNIVFGTLCSFTFSAGFLYLIEIFGISSLCNSLRLAFLIVTFLQLPSTISRALWEHRPMTLTVIFFIDQMLQLSIISIVQFVIMPIIM